MIVLFLLTNLSHLVHWHFLGFATLPPVDNAQAVDCGVDPNGTPKPTDLGDIVGALANFFSGGLVGLIGDVLKIVSHIATLIWDLGADPRQFFHDVTNWGLQTFFPSSLQTWFGGTISGTALQTGQGACAGAYQIHNIFGDLYDSTTGAAAILAAAAAASRVVRAMLDARVSGMVMVIDTVPRFFLAVVGSQALGKDIIVALVNGTADFGWALTSAILASGSANPGQFSWGNGMVGSMLSLLWGSNFSILSALITIPLIIMILYAVCLMIVRTIMLGFCFGTAPLAIATVAYDHKNRFFAWWTKLLIGSMMMPIVLGASIAISIKLAIDIETVPILGPIMAGVVMCCGVWFAGKAVHQLTWEHFSHGGAMGAVTALSTSASALPAVAGKIGQLGMMMGAGEGGMMSKLANIGSTLGQGLGANYGPNSADGRRKGGDSGGGGGGGGAPAGTPPPGVNAAQAQASRDWFADLAGKL